MKEEFDYSRFGTKNFPMLPPDSRLSITTSVSLSFQFFSTTTPQGLTHAAYWPGNADRRGDSSVSTAAPRHDTGVGQEGGIPGGRARPVRAFLRLANSKNCGSGEMRVMDARGGATARANGTRTNRGRATEDVARAGRTGDCLTLSG